MLVGGADCAVFAQLIVVGERANPLLGFMSRIHPIIWVRGEKKAALVANVETAWQGNVSSHGCYFQIQLASR